LRRWLDGFSSSEEEAARRQGSDSMIRLMLRMMFPFLGKGRVLACREVTPMLSEFMDRELGPEMMVKILEHLDICSACRRFKESLEATSRTLRADPAAPIPEKAAREMMENLRAEYRRAREELDDKTSE